MLDTAVQIALIILAGHSFTWDGHIFNGIRKLISEDGKISKPIYNCPICMTPWWGTFFYWLVFDGFNSEIGTTIDIIRIWFVTIGAATGFSVISVILIYAKDYFSARTPDKNSCCNDYEEIEEPKY